MKAFTLSLLLSIGFANPVFANVPVVPSNRLNLFLDSTSPFVASDYTIGTTPSLGQVKILKSNGNTDFYLALNMPNLGIPSTNKHFILDSVIFNSSAHTRISDRYNSLTGQCVDFVKAMIDDTINTTSKWHANEKLSLIPKSQLASKLAPGTVIAYFGSSATQGNTYSNIGQHTAIILNISTDSSGNPVGGNVVHENFLVSPFTITVNGTQAGSAPQTIDKNYLNWSDTSGIRSLGQYWTVDIY